MWIFTKCGFFSAVQHFEDEGIIHVRARFKGDLERLCATYGVTVDIKETPGNDYRYRMDFARDIWADIVMQEATAIDYDNFKNAVHDGTARDRAYMDVWWAMRQRQG